MKRMAYGFRQMGGERFSGRTGNAHVLYAREADEKTQLKDVVTRLSRLPDVLHAEPDMKMRHQK